MNPLISSLVHVMEFSVVMGVAVLVAHFFPEHRSTVVGLVGMLLSFAASYIRKSPEFPVPDYVNGDGK